MSRVVQPAPPVTSGRIARLALQLWQTFGDPPGFPRDPEPFLGLHLPVAVCDLPGLSCMRVSAWAARNGLPAIEAAPDRLLRGCLLALRGRAFLLVDPGDPAAERRVTLAHELGHFLLEIHEPRRRALHILGADALAMLDGDRPASFVERLHSVLGDAPSPAYAHLMTRAADGSIGCARIAAAECAADAFALELLAPRAELRVAISALAGQPLPWRRSLATELLYDRYGLPAAVAQGYAGRLVDEFTGGQMVREWLNL